MERGEGVKGKEIWLTQLLGCTVATVYSTVARKIGKCMTMTQLKRCQRHLMLHVYDNHKLPVC